MQQSAGIVLYRRGGGPGPAAGLEVFLVHPGGPFWVNKDAGAWSIPKGLVEPGEDLQAAARREFAEETGTAVEGELLPLGSVRQPSGKTIHAFAVEADIDAANIVSNTFEMVWPPNSSDTQAFPEVDRAAWLPLAAAYEKLLKGQRPFLDRLTELLASL